MKKIVCLCLILSCCTLFATPIQPNVYGITGVRGKVFANVEQRLKELEQIKPLYERSKEEVAGQVAKALEPFGYFKAKVVILSVQKNQTAIEIIPGPQTHISALKVELIGEGAQNPLLKKNLQKLKLQVGDALLIEVYNKAKQDLIDTAEHSGYLHASFKKAEILIHEQGYGASISLIFDTGPLYYFGQVAFDPTHINPELLHRFVPFKPGQAYSTSQILHLNSSLADSGYFNSVLVKPQIGADTSVPLRVHLRAVPKYTYTLGLGYGTDTGIRGRAGLNIIPVNSYGHKFQALAQGSITQNALQAQYVIPGQDPLRDQYLITGNASSLNYDAGYSNSLLLSLAQQHQAKLYKRVISLNQLYESFSYSLQPKSSQFMLYPKMTYVFKKTSDLLFSPSGYNISLNVLGASRFTMSHTSFFQTTLDAKAAYKITPWNLRLYGHGIYGLNATSEVNQLPLSLALLLGGTDNLKAYSFNSIGPGRRLVYTGLELQKEVRKNWYLLGFVDSGSVYNPEPLLMQHDMGGGLMWVSPIGPIKVGVAKALSNEGQKTGAMRLVVSMGPDL